MFFTKWLTRLLSLAAVIVVVLSPVVARAADTYTFQFSGVAAGVCSAGGGSSITAYVTATDTTTNASGMSAALQVTLNIVAGIGSPNGASSPTITFVTGTPIAVSFPITTAFSLPDHSPLTFAVNDSYVSVDCTTGQPISGTQYLLTSAQPNICTASNRASVSATIVAISAPAIIAIVQIVNHVQVLSIRAVPVNIVTIVDHNLSVPGIGLVSGIAFQETVTRGVVTPLNGMFPVKVRYSVPDHTLLTFMVNGTPTAVDCTTGTGYVPAAPPPNVPAGFVMKQVICTTPILNTSAGQPVGSAQVIAGQRWYVSPTSVTGVDGKSYTEIFTGGFTDGYIPTACINLAYNYVYGVN